MIKDIIRHNYLFLTAMAVILLLGTIFVHNIVSIQFAGRSFDFMFKRLAAILIGSFCMIVAVYIDTEYFKKYAVAGLIFVILMLSLLRVPGIGSEAYGAVRWLKFGGFSIQPTEFAKVALIFALSGWLANYSKHKLSCMNLYKELIAVAAVAFLVYIGPDLGNAVIIGLTGIAIIFISGLKWSEILVLFIVLVIGVYFSIAGKEWRIRRVEATFNPEQYKFDIGHQPYKSIQAVATGGYFGKGLGNSVNKNFHLRHGHTDYIFAIYAEETGLIGSILLLMLYIVLLFEGFNISYSVRPENYFRKYTSFGIIFLLSLQVFINLAVNVSIMPSTGLPLPLFSHGGSSIISTMIMIGFLLRINYENKRETD